MADFGTDLSCRDDLDPLMREVGGVELLSEAGHRRLHTPRGGLLDDADYGTDVADFTSAEATPAELAQVPGMLCSELRKDERFAAARGRMTTDAAGQAAAIAIAVETGAGPFSLTVPVGQAVTVQQLKGGG